MSSPTGRSPLPVLFSVVIVDLIGFGIVVPILPFYATEYGASPVELGLLVAAYAAMQMTFAPVWGGMSDRFGRRPILLCTIAGTALSLLALALADSLALLFFARLMAGCFGANVSVATAYVTDVTTEQDRTRWMGMIGASFGIGFLLGPAIGGLLAPYGYDVPMFVAAAMAGANLLVAAAVLQEPDRHEARETVSRMGLRTVLRTGQLRRMYSVYFLFSMGVTQLETIFALYMMDRFGYDARQVAGVLVLMAVVVAGIQGGGIRALAKRYGEKRLLLAGTALLGASFLLVPWPGSVGLLLVPLVVSAIGRGISQPSLMSMVSMESEARGRGVVMGAFQSSAALARVVGPLVAGALYAASQPAPFIAGGLLVLAACALALPLVPPRVVEEPALGEPVSSPS